MPVRSPDLLAALRPTSDTAAPARPPAVGGRLARLGLLGFAFFLAKGLLWLAALGWGARTILQ